MELLNALTWRSSASELGGYSLHFGIQLSKDCRALGFSRSRKGGNQYLLCVLEAGLLFVWHGLPCSLRETVATARGCCPLPLPVQVSFLLLYSYCMYGRTENKLSETDFRGSRLLVQCGKDVHPSSEFGARHTKVMGSVVSVAGRSIWQLSFKEGGWSWTPVFKCPLLVVTGYLLPCLSAKALA